MGYSIKNSRLLAEFREIDSYMTDSSEGESTDEDGLRQHTLAPTEFSNSVIRMCRTLLTAAKANRIDVADGSGVTPIAPKITLRLTRLDPLADSASNDPRIAKTVQCLLDMGIDVALGERQDANILQIPPPSSSSLSTVRMVPSRMVNLDLSILIALVSDLTHSALPLSIDEANNRFIPPKHHDRQWKKKVNEDSQICVLQTDGVDHIETLNADDDLTQHTRALTNQLFQEMSRSMLQEIHDHLTSPGNRSSLSPVQFWATPEAKERCLSIVSKIGGPKEKARARALFLPPPPLSHEDSYWYHSRFPPDLIPLMPINLLESNVPPLVVDATIPSLTSQNDPFFQGLERTCSEILKLEDDNVEDVVQDNEGSAGKLRKASPMKVNARLTAHTVRSMLWGAKLGCTTLTANRTSVKAMLREMNARRAKSVHSSEHSDLAGESETRTAAIWLVDPRSLAEGMRSNI